MARPKGFASWNPKAETLVVIADVQRVLREYQNHLPLTVRQIFYRLVGQYGYDKTERAYARLCEYLVRARRAQMISFEDIRDDGTIHHRFQKFTGLDDFWVEVASSAEHYSRDKLADQPVYVELWCEASGMVPQLERVANAYSVPVYSTGGFSSVTVTYEIAARALKRNKPTVFLHVGDFDPSGESIFEAMSRDACSFLLNRLSWKLEADGVSEEEIERLFPGGKLLVGRELPGEYPNLLPRRVALTAAQVEEHELPTAPPKASDTRSATWYGETCQAEAMPPDLLAEIVEDAISDVLDDDVLQEVRSAEHTEKGAIIRRVKAIRSEIDKEEPTED